MDLLKQSNGIILISYIDAMDQTSVLDIKPCRLSYDRINDPKVPKWFKEWPKSSEESADFNCEKVFNI